MRTRAPLFGFLGKTARQKISRSASDIGDRGARKVLADVSENVHFNPSKDSPSDNFVEPFGQSLSGSLSKTDETTLYQIANTWSDLSDNKLGDMSGPREYEANEECYPVTTLARPAMERSYSVNKRTLNSPQIPLPPSAASFYNGYSPQMEVVESCESIDRLNLYLKARKEDVSAGVPGRFLHAVMGQDVSDVGSFVSTIMYSFYLSETLKSNHFCTVPVMNMKRADLNSHAELKWLLDSCYIDESSLVFLDEIDLSYYDLFGSLKLVLLNGDKLPFKQEGNHAYPRVHTISVTQDCSSCALIAEMFALSSPEILASKGFSRLLLAGILLDTGNLTNPHCTTKDMYMATLLINGAGRFGCSGLYQILRYKMHDVSDLKVGEILRKDFKKWTRIGKPDSAGSRLMVSHVGMSSIGISVAQLLAHDETSTHEIIHFQQIEKLRLLMIVSGYYDPQKNFKREILVSAESAELMTYLVQFFESHESHLPLKDLHQPGLRDDMTAFKIDKVTSRRTIERLLEEFGDTLKC